MRKTQETHSRETVEKAYLLAEKGRTPAQIGRELSVHRWVVNKWISDPDRNSPFLDEVALDRALGGDVEVYNNMTRWEKPEFWLRVREIADQERSGFGYSSTEGVYIYARVASFFDMTTDQVREKVQAITARHGK